MYRNSRPQTPDRQPASRIPLYPLGPTVNFQPYQPIQPVYEVPKKFSTATLPSYQQRLIERQIHAKAKIPKEQLERDLISFNQAQVQNENSRRRLIQDSYIREIQRLQIILAKDAERKQKLISQIELLELDGKELALKVDEAKEQIPDHQFPEGLEKKQLEVMELKNQMVSQIRSKEEELLKERQQEEAIWEQKLKEKQNILILTQEKRAAAKSQLLKQKRELQTQIQFVPSSISDIARGRKYHEFKYDFDILKQKITALNEERQVSTRQIQQNKNVKSTIIKDQVFKLEQLKRTRTGLQSNIKEIELRNKQLERVNQNSQQELNRKQKLVLRYESDIQESRLKANDNQAQIQSKINQFRNRQADELFESLPKDIEDVQKRIREIQADTFRLRNDYKKLGEYLQSEVVKTVYQTFNDIKAT